MPDRRYTKDPCPCGDGFCAGCEESGEPERPRAPAPTRNARFWITYRGGSLVKLTMRPGDTIELAEGGATEEGYCHRYSKYEYPKDEAVIYAEFEESARDCDGRLDSHSESCCPVADLKNGYANERDWPGPGIAFPDWRSVRAFQRDYEAEKAGY